MKHSSSSKQNYKNRLLLIFIKNPVLEKVKTRLAATLGEEKALRIYKRLLDQTREVVKQVPVKKEVWYSDFIPDSDKWFESEFRKKLQAGENLGERMKKGFKTGFQNGLEKIVIIGGDCAQLQAVHINNAFKALEKNDAVIGPAYDGGYYLLGLKRIIPALFAEKPWGTETVFEKTINDFKRYNLSYQLLEELRDVDTEQDWEAIKEDHKA